MRLESVSIVGFGGIADRVDVDFDADVVVLVGANGFGKTTVCNAVAWAFTGTTATGENPRNLYSTTGATQVDLRVSFQTRSTRISRSLANPGETDPRRLSWSLSVSNDEERLTDGEAQRWIVAALAGSDNGDLPLALVDQFYLRQESLRDFLVAQEDTARFAAVAGMVGARSLNEFAAKLESSKTAWVRATNRTASEDQSQRDHLEDLRATRAALRAEMARVSETDLGAEWRTWLAAAGSALDLETLIDSTEFSEELLALMRERLAEQKSRLGVLETSLRSLEAELESEASQPPVPTSDFVAETANRLSDQLDEAQRIAARIRARVDAIGVLEKTRLRQQAQRDEIATIANLMLQHVDDTCLACGQNVEPRAFENRLRGLLTVDNRRDETSDQLDALRRELSDDEELLRHTRRETQDLEIKHREMLQRRASAGAAAQQLRSRLRELVDVDVLGDGDALTDLELASSERSRAGARRRVLSDLEVASARFESVSNLTSMRRRVDRLDLDVAQLAEKLRNDEAETRSRVAVGVEVDALVRRLKADAEGYVADRLTALEPLLDQLYAAIDPHPTFRTVGLLTRQARGKHRLHPELRDDIRDVAVADPGSTLSTSQANAFAIALFLSFNLGFERGSMETLVLDDPLQNLDDVHLLGLVDLLRKVAPRRQLVLTTHDHALAGLLSRKLRPLGPEARTTIVTFTGWDRRGPQVRQTDVPREESPFRVVVA